MSNKLDKYIGRAKPKIYRLSGTSWDNIKQKVKKDAHLLAEQLLNLYAKRKIVNINKWKVNPELLRDIEASFPYEETNDQVKTLKEVYQDLRGTKPMDRLIVGDVGFGKTEIALRTAYLAVMNGYQVAFLCPTTIAIIMFY